MFVHRHRVLYADTDMAGIVYHANYLRFFEAARGELLRAGGLPYAEIERRGLVMPIVESRLRHRRPARYDDLLAIETWVSELRAASVTVSYAARRHADGELLCEGSTLLACTRREGGVIPLPLDLREVLAQASGPERRPSARHRL